MDGYFILVRLGVRLQGLSQGSSAVSTYYEIYLVLFGFLGIKLKVTVN